MNEDISLSDLKRKKIRKTIICEDTSVEIYNPSPEQQEEIVKIIMNDYDAETKELKLTESQVLETLIPMLTNITIDTDNEESMKEVIEDPSDILLEIQDELSDIVRSIIKRFVKMIEILNGLTEEEVNKLYGDDVRGKQ